MIDHQRSVLNTLGIDLWIPRDAVCVAKTIDSIWRDQSSTENPADIFEFSVSSQPVAKNIAQSMQILVTSNTQLEKTIGSERGVPEPIARQISVKNTSIQNGDVATISVQQETVHAMPLEVAHMDVCPAFQLQAMVFTQCTLVANTTDFTAQHWALWQSLQQVLVAQTVHLEWPFPLLHMQDARGVVCYIQGFLDSTGMDRPIFVLGSLPYVEPQAHWEILPSVQQMLDHPLLKKQLWQRLYTQIYKV